MCAGFRLRSRLRASGIGVAVGGGGGAGGGGRDRRLRLRALRRQRRLLRLHLEHRPILSFLARQRQIARCGSAALRDRVRVRFESLLRRFLFRLLRGIGFHVTRLRRNDAAAAWRDRSIIVSSTGRSSGSGKGADGATEGGERKRHQQVHENRAGDRQPEALAFACKSHGPNGR